MKVEDALHKQKLHEFFYCCIIKDSLTLIRSCSHFRSGSCMKHCYMLKMQHKLCFNLNKTNKTVLKRFI